MKHSLSASVSAIALGAGLAVSPVSSADAALICGVSSCTGTYSTGSLTTDFTNSAVTLDFFNPGIGQVLTKLTITETGSVNSSGTLKNTSGQTQSFTFNFGEKLKIAPGIGAPISFPSTTFAGGPQIATSAAYSLAGGASTAFSFSSALSSKQQIITGGNLSQYIGAGTFQALLSSLTSQGFAGGGGNIEANLSTTAVADVTLFYEFTTTTDVPEPATLAILGAGLAGVGVLRRRRTV